MCLLANDQRCDRAVKEDERQEKAGSAALDWQPRCLAIKTGGFASRPHDRFALFQSLVIMFWSKFERLPSMLAP